MHTPGPWKHNACPKSRDPFFRLASAVWNGEQFICSTSGAPGRYVDADPETQDANARLIAAAPAMLEALRWIADHGDTGEGRRPAYHDMRAKARAAIALAETVES